MRTKLLPLVLSVGIAAAAFAFALKQRHTRHDLERGVQTCREWRVQMEGKIRRAEERQAATESEQRRVRAILEAPREKQTAPAAAAERALKSALAGNPMTAFRAALRDDPRLQNLHLAATQRKLLTTYRALFEQMNLPEAKIAAFLAILARRSEQEMDLSAIMEAQPKPVVDQVFTTLKREMAGEVRQGLREAIGDAGLARFEIYERAVPARLFIDGFAGTAANAGETITGGQADALTETIANASTAFGQGGTVMLPTVDWDKVLAEAGATLSEPQRAVLKNASAQYRFINRLRELAKKG